MKLKFYLLLLMMCTLNENYIWASLPHSVSMEIPLNRQSTVPDYREAPRKGNRMPSMSEYCMIDFDQYLIETSVSETIESYEIWNAEGVSVFATFPDELTFVQCLAGIEGLYQIRLVTDEYIYIGCIEL